MSTPPERAAALIPTLGRLLTATFREGCSLKQLSMTQVKAMTYLCHNPGWTLTDLSADLGIALGTASEIVDRLVELTLVERTTNPANRRQVLLSLTPDAEAMAREVGRQRVEQFEEVFARLSDAESDAFLRGLVLWVESLQRRVDQPATAPTIVEKG